MVLDNNLVNFFVVNKITPNQFLLLAFINDNSLPLSSYLKENGLFRKEEVDDLHNKEFLKHITGDYIIGGMELTTKGRSLFKSNVIKSGSENWIDEYLNLFPEGVKTGLIPVKCDRESCIKKMNLFLRKYPYDKKTILKATERYVREKAQYSYAYMKTAAYFIIKDDISLLADFCKNINEREDDPFKETI